MKCTQGFRRTDQPAASAARATRSGLVQHRVAVNDDDG
jgi:hypothetical protein